MGGSKGRLTRAEERAQAIALIGEACAQGARKRKACELLNLPLRTLERWEKGDLQDKRKSTMRPVQKKQLTKKEKAMIISICNQPEYAL